MIWSLRKYRRLQRRYLDAISRAVGYRVESFYDPLFVGLPKIYTRGSRPWRLRKAFTHACNRDAIVTFGLGLGWLFFGGWLLVTLYSLVSWIVR
jgi:hypothetical protein